MKETEGIRIPRLGGGGRRHAVYIVDGNGNLLSKTDPRGVVAAVKLVSDERGVYGSSGLKSQSGLPVAASRGEEVSIVRAAEHQAARN